MSKVKALYHIVFCTKNRRQTIPLPYKEDLYRFIWRKICDHKCGLIRIGGVTNHVHLLIDLHPSVSLSSLMQVIKGSSSNWMKTDPRFKYFEGWASDYFASTVAFDAQRVVVEYIKNQEAHHLGQPFDDEIKKMYREAAVEYDDRDLV